MTSVARTAPAGAVASTESQSARFDDFHADSTAHPVRGWERVPPASPTLTGIAVDPRGLREVLERVHHEYTTLPLVVTETGLALHDYVSPDGTVAGEYRFLGLYTHAAYSESITRIPVLRRKLAGVLEAAGLTADSHDGKDLAEFLENYPREELFQTPVAELVPIADGVLRLRDRKQTRLFLRKDTYGRYMSCLVYMPRDRYTTAVRLRAQEILLRALDGDSVDYSVMVGASPVARLQIVVRAGRGRTLPEVDEAALERELAAAVRSWDDDLAEEAVRVLGAPRARALLAMCDDTIPDTYKADVPAAAHTRLPGYLRSHVGTVKRVFEGDYAYFKHTGDGIGDPMPIYIVAFSPTELWGERRE